jgi:Protein of unknown function (DUF1592)/Protein of unknown function (DUF1588)/Protein of unknown function (DUF1585)/Protein of unknown function (DUF1595)/Protein of unknown function (DUF1587)
MLRSQVSIQKLAPKRAWYGALALLLCAGCSGDLGAQLVDTVPKPPTAGSTEPLPDVAAPPEPAGSFGAFDQAKPVDGQEFTCETPGVARRETQLRRLSVAEYTETVSRVLRVDPSLVAQVLISSQDNEGFQNSDTARYTLLVHVDAFNRAAKLVAETFSLDLVAPHLTHCQDFSPACVQSWIDELGTGLHRRPPEGEDRAAMLSIVSESESSGATFSESMRFLVEFLLQSPRFLYHLEQGLLEQPTRLDDYELSARLAYLVWGGPPDKELLDAAGRGELRETTPILRQLDRMLLDPRAQLQSERFLIDWLNLEGLTGTPLLSDFQRETLDVFHELVWVRRAPLPSLFNADFTIASPLVASLYGFAVNGSGHYVLGKSSGRIGILTHGSTLWNGDQEVSNVGRGLYIMHQYLCGEIQKPPPGLDTTALQPEPGKSVRFYSEQRLNNPACGACHAQFEPLAFPLVPFDGAGRRRSADQYDNPLPSDGTLRTYYDPDGKPMADVRALGEHLARDPRVHDCLVLKLSEYAWGRHLSRADGCSLSAVRAEAQEENLTYAGVLRALVREPAFRALSSFDAPTEAPGAP